LIKTLGSAEPKRKPVRTKTPRTTPKRIVAKEPEVTEIYEA